jgi:hypothetical protein
MEVLLTGTLFCVEIIGATTLISAAVSCKTQEPKVPFL